jgi:hypothetical protein
MMPLLTRSILVMLDRDAGNFGHWQWTLKLVAAIVSTSIRLWSTIAFVMTLKRFALAAYRTGKSGPSVNETKSEESCAVR